MINTESRLVQHAIAELEYANVEEDVRPSIIAAVSAFASYGHSGGSASVVIPMLNDLLQFKNISPLTNNPDEWMMVADAPTNGENLWQSTRRSSSFSTDGGRTYYDLDEQRSWLTRFIPWGLWRRLSASTRTRIMFPVHTSEWASYRVSS